MNTPSLQHRKWINIARGSFIALFTFEYFNFLKIMRYTPDFTWFGLIITVLFVAGCLELAEYAFSRYLRVHLPWQTWFFALFSVLFDAAGDVFHFYTWWAHYDQVAHFSGGAMTALVAWCVLKTLVEGMRWKIPLPVIAYATYVTAFSITSFYEIEEYTQDRLFHSKLLGNGFDTANDLLMDALGALVVVSSILYRYWQGQKRAATGRLPRPSGVMARPLQG